MTSDTHPSVHDDAVAPDRIIVNGLVVETFVGIHDFERRTRQQVRFDVEVDTVDGYADIVRAAGTFVSYAEIVEFIEAHAATGGHVELVETWAEDVAAFVLGNELASAVRVSVQKTDIFERADGVGVAIERRRARTGTR
jgi:dihydroneopterin aldolase